MHCPHAVLGAQELAPTTVLSLLRVDFLSAVAGIRHEAKHVQVQVELQPPRGVLVKLMKAGEACKGVLCGWTKGILVQIQMELRALRGVLLSLMKAGEQDHVRSCIVK